MKKLHILFLALFLAVFAYGATHIYQAKKIAEVVQAQTAPQDWPQLQHDAQRTGRTTATMQANVRARWIWLGPNKVLRNKKSKTAWTDDLDSYAGHNLALPTSVPYTFADSMQPIIVNNKVFVGDYSAQKVWAVNLDDGSTLWEASNPGGTQWPGVATSTRVVFNSMQGLVTGWDASNGNKVWQIDTGRTISSAPALSGSTVIVTSQNGKVYSINIDTGAINWQTDTGAPITSHPTIFQNRVYVGNEAMYAVALDLNTGTELARQKLIGQSFRGIWFVGVGNRVIYNTAPLPYLGSEYAYDGVLDTSSGSFQNEQLILKNRLTSDMKNWQHIFALKYDTLSNDYVIPLGPVGGVGFVPDPVVLTQTDQPITWWPTYYGTISTCTFGCRAGFDIDIASFDLNTGMGVQLPGAANPITNTETDNTFGMTVGGTIVYLRQNFRGTKAVDLKNLTSFNMSSVYRWHDCGGFLMPLNYLDGNSASPCSPPVVPQPKTAAQLSDGHVGPAIIPNQAIFTETFALTVMEHY